MTLAGGEPGDEVRLRQSCIHVHMYMYMYVLYYPLPFMYST